MARSRSSSKHTNKLGNVASGSSTVSYPSGILKAVLSELKLSYDLTLGTIGGDAVTSPPNLDNLGLLKKQLNNLKQLLEKVVVDDVSLLKKIDEQLDSKEDKIDHTRTRGTKRSIEDDEETKMVTKHEIDEDDDENGPLSKKKRPRHEVVDMDTSGEDLKDDDDIPLAAVRADTRVGVNTITEHFPKPKEEEPIDEDAISAITTNKDDDETEEQYHTPEGDNRVKNPKSEFVTAQTLPAAAALLGLYSEEDGGLDQNGEEYLKKKYAVASYPSRDLKELLPGPIPDIDFSKSKPSNQVQFTTFQSYTDIYFRPYSEDDIKFLNEKYVVSPLLGKNYDPLLHPFFIPKLGPLYSEQWAQEEPLSGIKLSTPSQARVNADNIVPKGSADQLTDELLEMDTVSCGPLVSRLLSALIPDQTSDTGNGLTKEEDGDDNDNDNEHDKKINSSSSSALEDQQGWNANIAQADYSQLEQRLRRELKYIGVYMNVNQTLKDMQASLTGGANNNGSDLKVKDEFQEDWILGKEDDEVCAEMRSLQRELSQLTRKNNRRKQILIPLVEEQIAWQEYMSILEDLDKQIDQAYLKRMRAPKKLKKRGHSQQNTQAQQLTPSAMAAQQLQQLQQAAANSGLKSLLDKRSRWIGKIGPLFKSNELMRRIPKESVFKNVDLSKEEEDNEELDDGTSGINNETNGGELIDE